MCWAALQCLPEIGNANHLLTRSVWHASVYVCDASPDAFKRALNAVK